MQAWEEAELASIHAAFATPVGYTINGSGDDPVNLPAVRSTVSAEDFTGPGNSRRITRFEIRYDGFASAFGRGEPANGDMIDEDGRYWRVIEVIRRDDVGAWSVAVEKRL